MTQGKKHWEAYQTKERETVEAKRQAFARNEFFVPSEAKFLLVVRIKGINKVPPKEKKIM